MATLLYKTRALYEDTLLRNSLYILLTTAVVSASGFFFWLLSAHVLPAEQIGLATTLVSAMNLISTLGLLGLDTTLIRYLQDARNKSDEITTALIAASAAGLLLGALFIGFVGFLSPELQFIQHNAWYALLFALFCAGSTANLLTGAVFLSYRNVQRSFTINASLSVLKLFFPLFFLPFGAFGIFAAAATAQTLAALWGVAVLVREFKYQPRVVFDTSMVRRVFRYSIGNYVSGTLYLVPQSLLPLIITATLGAQDTAYFYIVTMIGNLLYTVPAAVSRSLFAESAYDEEMLGPNSRTSLYAMLGLVAVGVVCLFALGRYLLILFGHEYATDGLVLLYFIAITAFPQCAYSYFGVRLRLRHETAPLVFINIVYALSVLSVSYALLPLGLFGIGIAWLAGTVASAAVSYACYVAVLSEPSLPARSLLERAHNTLSAYWEPIETLLWAKYLYYRARVLGRPRHTLLLYPEKPKKFHIIYKIAHFMGWKIVHDPRTPADLVIYFEDITRRARTLPLPHQKRVLNSNCGDISKMRVEEIFREVFGYSSFVDPRTYAGECVKKSDANAVHDGEIISCPTEPQAGYVYQKLIHNEINDSFAQDIRVCVMGSHVAILCIRNHPLHDRFDATHKAVVAYPEDYFSPGEIRLMLEFCKKLGMEYGELDVVRDQEDRRMYILDANNTPAGPRRGGQMSALHHDEFVGAMGRSLQQQFLS